MEHGYSLHGPDNGLHFYDGDDVPACPVCGLVDDPRWMNPRLRMRRRRFDVSSTYDGRNIVSERFRALTASAPGIRFIALPNDPDFFVPVVDAVVEMNIEARPPKLSDQCEACGRWTQIARGGPPMVLMPESSLPEGFSRSDQIYGSATGHTPPQPVLQGPFMLVSEELGARLQAEELKGLYLEPVIDDFAQWRKDRGLV